jgi:hypothetical protein
MMTAATAHTARFVAPFLIAGIIGIAVGAISVVWPRDTKERAVCDEAVQQLLTTKDEIELRRAIFLIRWLNCSVRSRLP